MGALYLQQCACILPAREDLAPKIARVVGKIADQGGEHWLLTVPNVSGDDQTRLITSFRDLRNKEYAEIIEECETKFVKEIEFEHFRKNYSFEEAEEIGQDLEKIRRWFRRVSERDWFGADRRPEVEAWIDRCAGMLAQFEEVVYRQTSDDFATGVSPLTLSIPTADGPDIQPEDIP
jgi:hypothetical protein